MRKPVVYIFVAAILISQSQLVANQMAHQDLEACRKNMVIYITMREIYPIRFDYVLADSASYFATPSTLIIPAKGSLSTIPISDPYLR